MGTPNTKKSPPMHFYADMSGETLCGANNQRVRSTSHLKHWDDLNLAAGRRCPECAPGVEVLRKASSMSAGM